MCVCVLCFGFGFGGTQLACFFRVYTDKRVRWGFHPGIQKQTVYCLVMFVFDFPNKAHGFVVGCVVCCDQEFGGGFF